MQSAVYVTITCLAVSNAVSNSRKHGVGQLKKFCALEIDGGQTFGPKCFKARVLSKKILLGGGGGSFLGGAHLER